MENEKQGQSYRDNFSQLPKLKSTARYDEQGNIRSISVEATDKPLYAEEQLTRFEIPRFLWKRPQ